MFSVIIFDIPDTHHYMHTSANFYRVGAIARIYSPYILSASRTCIRFYHQIHLGGITLKLNYKAVNQIVYDRSATVSSNYEWERAEIQLPGGYFRVVFEAYTSKIGSTEGADVSVDDLFIGPCSSGKVFLK